MSKELFQNLPDIIDAKILAEALSISKSGAYALMNEKDFPTLHIGGRKLVAKPDLIEWIARHTGREREKP
ncbi:helix-turn-helix domain-containing protein [Butyrivibrio sp. INlla14]|uniref:helix-turn-helix domain-containing protein n=1 Tax=Butyrivibrio sp. INlla14 TaxID=1520808 RepID=UPI000876F9E3|nr:helix-turn-helix domain-containing protein [Butyrivibrio sp. INlla14]SCY61884.1 transcriptional regulator, AlpA family [Butyrivibrio sp. INlla14]